MSQDEIERPVLPAAPCFSLCAPISVASMSMMIPRAEPGLPGVLARPRASGPQRVEQVGIAGDLIDHPKRGSVRGHGAEQRLLVADRTQVGQAVTAVGEHHRQIPDNATGIVLALALTDPAQRVRQCPRQPEPVGRLGQKRRARVQPSRLRPT
jgi:hypothetical protein